MIKCAIISSIQSENFLNLNKNIADKFDIFLMSYKDHNFINEKYSYAKKIINLKKSATGMKYINLSESFELNELLNYDFIYIPDDDTCVDYDELYIFLKIMQNDDIHLAQVSLSHDSYYSHLITLNDKRYIYRETNFIEGMSPIFSKYALKELYETFTINNTSWGLDYLWCYKMLKEQKKIAICDMTQMKHYRKPMSNYGDEGSIRAYNDMMAILNKYNISQEHKTLSFKEK